MHYDRTSQHGDQVLLTVFIHVPIFEPIRGIQISEYCFVVIVLFVNNLERPVPFARQDHEF